MIIIAHALLLHVVVDMCAILTSAKFLLRRHVLPTMIVPRKKHAPTAIVSSKTDNRLQTKEAPSSGGFFVLLSRI